jgi:hypothetical protein
LLLLSATPLPALDHWVRPSPAQPAPLSTQLAVTSWYGVLKNWDGSVVVRPRVDWEVVRYARGADEVRFLALLLEVAPGLQATIGNNDSNQMLTKWLNQRAASSTFAAEQSLRRYRLKLSSRVTNITRQIESDLDADTESEDLETEGKTNASTVTDTSSVLKLVEACLDALESVNTDEKLLALKALIRSIALAKSGQSLKICILSMYVDTVAYLHSALQDADIKMFKITGRDSFADRVAIVEECRRTNGLLVGTDGGISGGIELRDVTHLIHYDVPTDPMIMEQRRGKVDRYGRTTPCTMYIFRDNSGVVPFESEVIDRLAAVSLGDDKASALTE